MTFLNRKIYKIIWNLVFMRDWAGKNISSSETKDLSELVLRHVVPDRGADVHHHPFILQRRAE